MINLLDENFPLRFYTRPQKDGLTVRHILLIHRRIPDKEIIERLKREELLFLAQDEYLIKAAPDRRTSIFWSRVSQSMAIDRRVEIVLAP